MVAEDGLGRICVGGRNGRRPALAVTAGDRCRTVVAGDAVGTSAPLRARPARGAAAIGRVWAVPGRAAGPGSRLWAVCGERLSGGAGGTGAASATVLGSRRWTIGVTISAVTEATFVAVAVAVAAAVLEMAFSSWSLASVASHCSRARAKSAGSIRSAAPLALAKPKVAMAGSAAAATGLDAALVALPGAASAYSARA